MTHEEIQILISAYIDGEVTPSEKTIVEEHLSSCPSCQKDYKKYMAMSSSLSKWSDETLSPDETINVQRRFEQRREPMFTKRTMMTLGTTLALTIIVGSVVQVQLKKGMQGRLKSASDDVSDQYLQANTAQYQPYYQRTSYRSASAGYGQFSQRLAGSDPTAAAVLGSQGVQYQPMYAPNSGNLSMGQFAIPVRMKAINTLRTGNEGGADYYQDPNAAYYSAVNEEDRKKIQRADISLVVDNAFKTKSQLTDLILQFNGIIVSSNFNRSADGSGQGAVICKVYPKDLEPALQQVRKLGEVENESETSTDVTEEYKNAQSSMDSYTIKKDHLQKILNTFKLFNPTTDEEKENTQRRIAQIEDQIEGLDRMIKFYQQQTSMSLIVVNFHDNYQNSLKKTDTDNNWKTMMESKWKDTMDSSLEVFTSIFFGGIFLLSYVAPVLIWAIIFGVIYFIVRLFFKK